MGFRSMPRWFGAHLLLIALLFTPLTLDLNAQVEKGGFTGVVKDTTGAVLPGASITIRNMGTNEVRKALTNDQGLYRVTGLVPGVYELRAELQGFKAKLDTNVDLAISEMKRVDFVLEVGEIQEVITVVGEAALVNTEEGRVAARVSGRQITELPLNGRNVYQLIRLAPGAVNSTGVTFYGGEAGGFGGSPSADTVVNGVRQEFNGFLMDGVTNRNFGTAGAMFTPSVDAVAEFRLETTNFSAEFGEAGAMITNLVTRSGTNEFHGSAWQFHRNDNLDASNYFDPQELDDSGNFVRKLKPEFKWNQFGFTAGGPIRKDKTFAFGYYEGFRLRTQEAQSFFVETPEFRDFVTRNFPGTVAALLFKSIQTPTPTRSIVTVSDYAQAFSGFGYDCQPNCGASIADTLKAFPRFVKFAELADRFRALPDDMPMIGELDATFPANQTSDQFMLRLDHSWNDGKDKMMGRYSFLRSGSISFQPPTPRTLSDSTVSDRIQNFAFTQTHIFSPTVVNEFRFGFARTRDDIVCTTCGIPLIGFDSGEAQMGAYNGFPQLFRDEVFEWRDILSINRGNHGLKAGVEFRRRREPSEFNVARPSYYFFDMFWFAVDSPYLQIAGVDPGVEISTTKPVTAATPKVRGAQLQSNIRDWRSVEFSWFINDDWKVTRNFTLNLGVRWDLYGRLHEARGRGTKFIQPSDSLFGNVIFSPGFVSVGEGTFAEQDRNNFAPRLGFAWDPTGSGKTSIRGGYGIAYQSMFFNPLANSRWQMPWYSFNIVFPIFGSGNSIIYGPPRGVTPTFTGPASNIGQGDVGGGNIMGWDPTNPNLSFLTGIQPQNARDPYVQSIFFGIERELPSKLVVKANYVSTLGRKIIRAEDPNRFPGDRVGLPNPLTGANAGDRGLNRLNPNFGTLRFWLNDSNSSYHAFQLEVNRAVSEGFGFNLSYSVSKAIDTRSGWHNSSTNANGRADGFSLDPFNFRARERGPAAFDIRQKFNFNWVWDLPKFSGSSPFVRQVLGGWQLSGILSLQTGPAFTVWCGRSFAGGCDWNADGWNNDRPLLKVAPPKASGPHSFVNGGLFDLNRDGSPDRGIGGPNDPFDNPPVPGFSNLGRNTFRGPGFAGVDLSIVKDFAVPAVSEQFKIQFRAEFFNLFNRVNFHLSESPFNAIGNIGNPNFGEAVKAFDSRQIQFALKVLW